MSEPVSRSYFIVKHDLLALKKLPNFCWSTHYDAEKAPPVFQRVKIGDRWVGFAWTSGDEDDKRLSLVTGFYECITEARHRSVVVPSYFKGKAWMIEGKECGEQPRQETSIPPINKVLNRNVKNMGTLIQITAEDFNLLRKVTLARDLDPETIPLLHREPECEQELLAVVANGHKKLGISQIIKVNRSFPDMLVKIEGCSEEIYLELEQYSSGFYLHRHDEAVRRGKFKDGKPVAVLCWIDDEPKVKQKVHKVYELQSLMRDSKKLTW